MSKKLLIPCIFISGTLFGFISSIIFNSPPRKNEKNPQVHQQINIRDTVTSSTQVTVVSPFKGNYRDQIEEQMRSSSNNLEDLANRYALLSRWAKDDPAAMAHYLEAHPDFPQQELVMEKLFADWAQTDLQALRIYLKENKNDKIQSLATLAYLKVHFDQHPSQTLSWIQDNLTDNAGLKRDAQLQYFTLLAQQDPEKSISLITQTLAGDTQQHALLQTASEWATQSPEAAFNWLRSLDENSDTDQSFVAESMLKSLATAKPQEAVSHYMSLASNIPDLRENLFPKLIESYYKAKPEETLGWISSIEDEHFFGRAIDGVMDVLIQTQGHQAFEYASQWDDPKIQEKLATRVVEQLQDRRPKEVLDQLSQMNSFPNKQELIQEVLRSWQYENPEDAKKWLKSQ